MRLTVLGGSGAWPTPEAGCSGYLVERDGFHLLLDPGYATLPRLLSVIAAARVDAVLVSHGHPDHCADLNPLLRARALGDRAMPLPVHCPPGALDAVLRLDGRMLEGACELREFEPGARFEVGPFRVGTAALPHFVPNAGFRLEAGDRVLVHTGDTGPGDAVPALAEGADLLLAEATFPAEVVPPEDAPFLSTAAQAGRSAAAAGVATLMLTHLWPGTDPREAVRCARTEFSGEIRVATPGAVWPEVAPPPGARLPAEPR